MKTLKSLIVFAFLFMGGFSAKAINIAESWLESGGGKKLIIHFIVDGVNPNAFYFPTLEYQEWGGRHIYPRWEALSGIKPEQALTVANGEEVILVWDLALEPDLEHLGVGDLGITVMEVNKKDNVGFFDVLAETSKIDKKLNELEAKKLDKIAQGKSIKWITRRIAKKEKQKERLVEEKEDHFVENDKIKAAKLQEKKDIARKMLALNKSDDEIRELTRLTLQQIADLKE